MNLEHFQWEMGFLFLQRDKVPDRRVLLCRISPQSSVKGRGVMLVVFCALQGPLEDWISLRLLDDGEEGTDHGVKNYSLSQLTMLQNKLMLIARKAEEGREETNRFLEVSHSTAPTSASKTVAVGLGIFLELFPGPSSMTCSCGLSRAEVLLWDDAHFPTCRSGVCFPQHCSSVVGPDSPSETFPTSLWKDSWNGLSSKGPLKII